MTNRTSSRWLKLLGSSLTLLLFAAHVRVHAADVSRHDPGELLSSMLQGPLDDPQGGVRDPQMHYDGQKILFSYRRGGTPTYGASPRASQADAHR